MFAKPTNILLTVANIAYKSIGFLRLVWIKTRKNQVLSLAIADLKSEKFDWILSYGSSGTERLGNQSMRISHSLPRMKNCFLEAAF